MAVSEGLRLGAAGRFVHRFKRWIGAAILVAAAIVLFTWNYPTTMVVVWTAVIVLVGFALREFLDTGSAPAVKSKATTAPEV
jgi:chromate transport protein ChrA